jgi:hypothetical protein
MLFPQSTLRCLVSSYVSRRWHNNRFFKFSMIMTESGSNVTRAIAICAALTSTGILIYIEEAGHTVNCFL